VANTINSLLAATVRAVEHRIYSIVSRGL